MLKSPPTNRGKPLSGNEKSGETVLTLLHWDHRLYRFKIGNLVKDPPKRSTSNKSRAATSGLSKNLGRTVV